ncbi:unnamed protein product [Lymnaea stagnalis]|uniref:NXPE C-terminal domain-containing protein n=1 Tax=Lymnaea stagnalis TaxID=6523 RepID=A0AAV2INA4_LYMST
MIVKKGTRFLFLNLRPLFTVLTLFGICAFVRHWLILRKERTEGYHSGPQNNWAQRWLDRVTTGRWVARNYTAHEMDELETFIGRVWSYYKIPLTLQREDKKCGNLTFPGLGWFRALCDPKGATPCCMNGLCVNDSVQGCQCPECYDMRQRIHAELASWEPYDTTIQLTQFTSEKDVCRVLQNKTVYFIGDSFMRQLYTSVLAMLRDAKPRHVIRNDVPLVNVTNCDKYYRFIADCRGYIIEDTQECTGTTTLRMKTVYQVTGADVVLNAVRELNGTVDSWMVVGLGGHDYYNMTAVRQTLIDPILKMLKNSKWPKLIWMAAHSVGLLKSGTEKRQQTQALLDYNEKLASIFSFREIPVLNFFQLTKGIFSFDGAHYGKGVNDVKVKILLNFLQRENKTRDRNET